jgi:hypothetical protein
MLCCLFLWAWFSAADGSMHAWGLIWLVGGLDDSQQVLDSILEKQDLGICTCKRRKSIGP